MKTLIITIAILGSSLLNNSYGNGTINMNEKLQKVMTFKNGALSVEKIILNL
ncbi:MAG: hypothetical protein JKY30_14760 [Flavobacteriales bacterium]|nr:hypothetical protein [Flavobacteriales bacterium]